MWASTGQRESKIARNAGLGHPTGRPALPPTKLQHALVGKAEGQAGAEDGDLPHSKHERHHIQRRIGEYPGIGAEDHSRACLARWAIIARGTLEFACAPSDDPPAPLPGGDNLDPV